MPSSHQKQFAGFQGGKIRFTQIPDPFFTELLPQIDDLNELRITLYIIWVLEQREGNIRFVRRSEMLADTALMLMLSEAEMDAALTKSVARGSVLEIISAQINEPIYLLNTVRSRNLVEAYKEGKWVPGNEKYQPVGLDLVKPNIFKLYEQHIGMITPLIAELLKEAEQQYPASWFEDAFRIAVSNNVRKWKYIEAILRSWQERGKDDEDRRDPQKNNGRYIEGEFASFVEE